MNTSRKIAAVAIAVAALSGCASTRVAELASTDAAPAAPAAAPREVSRPAPSYGSLGGYRYRRLVKVTITSS